MASGKDRILCIDIGGDSIKAAEFSHPQNDTVVLEKYSFREFSTGDVSPDDPQYKLSVMQAVNEICNSPEYSETKNVYLSISGQNAFIRFVKVPAMTDDPEKIQKLLEFEAKQNIPFPEEEIVYGSQIIGARDEDTSQVEAMFAIVKNSDVEGYISNVESSGKAVREVEIASTACYNACHFNSIGKTQCEMLLNIGGRSSTLIFVDQGQFFVRTFLTAGHAITQQISKEFNISYEDAEELKRRHGFVGLGGAYEEPESAVAATVSKIIRNVMTRLHGEIIRTINVYRANHGRKPEKLYLTGGSSVMTYTPHFFSEKLKIPVEYFNPFQIIPVAQTIDKENLASVAHLFSEVIGLAIRTSVQCPVQISLMPEVRKKQEALKKKIPFFYASCVALVFCVSVTFWSFSKQYHTAKDLADRSKTLADSTTKVMNAVQKSSSTLKTVQSDLSTAQNLLAGRNTWMEMVNKVQDALPKGVWLISFEGVEDVVQTTVKSKAGTKKIIKSKNSGMSGMPGMGMGGPDGGAMPNFDKMPDFSSMGGMGMGMGMMSGDDMEVPKIQWLVLKGNIIVATPSGNQLENGEKETAEVIFAKLKDNLQKCKKETIVKEVKSSLKTDTKKTKKTAKKDSKKDKAKEKKKETVSEHADMLFEPFTNADIDRMDRNFKLAPIGSNVSSFTIELKLTAPIER